MFKTFCIIELNEGFSIEGAFKTTNLIAIFLDTSQRSIRLD